MKRPIVEFSLAVKKDKSMTFTRKWVELMITVLSEINYTHKREICLDHMWNLNFPYIFMTCKWHERIKWSV